MNGPADRLLQTARQLIPNCYCPYSGFRVTAVLEDTEGNLYPGVNVENGSFGLTVCAERSAVFGALSRGSREFTRILIHSPDGVPYPCGACREVLAEFCQPDFPVIISGDGSLLQTTLGELLPHRFSGIARGRTD